MRTVSAILAFGMAAQSAAAQPGQTTSWGPQPGPPGAPPPYSYQPQGVITDEEREILATGEIGDGQVIGGGLATMFVGFGVGQAVEGRWHDTG